MNERASKLGFCTHPKPGLSRLRRWHLIYYQKLKYSGVSDFPASGPNLKSQTCRAPSQYLNSKTCTIATCPLA
ncbi:MULTISPECIES: hypothetical protein [Microcoleaceae]|uniref:hypothetical protein n=1 Tax=Microcoleaceae TaxID=1892252 RepID=UPI0018800780|nr:hypothetical protein [Tychonema sp. LEGE 06208]MBE9165625.1 hypothetical protein [Tychonema sp. LEGE 06208]